MSGHDVARPATVAISVTIARYPAAVAVGLVATVALGLLALLAAESQMTVAAVLCGFAILALFLQKASAGEGVLAAAAAAPVARDLAVIAAALTLVVVFREADYALLMMATVGFFATAGLGLTLQTAFGGIANFAGGAFFAVGSYTAALLMAHTGLPHILILGAAGAAAGVAGLIVLLPVLRTRGHYAALVTIGFGVLLRTFLEVNDTLGGTQGLKIPSFSLLGTSLNEVRDVAGFDVSFYCAYAVMALAMLGTAAILLRLIEASWIGVALDVVRADEVAASVFGLGIARWKAFAFVLGNVMIGVAGAGYAIMNGFVNPSGASLEQSLLIISIVVLGGLGNLWGVVAGATIILVLPEKLQSIQEYRLALFSGLVLAVLLFRPAGLLPRRLRVLARKRTGAGDA